MPYPYTTEPTGRAGQPRTRLANGIGQPKRLPAPPWSPGKHSRSPSIRDPNRYGDRRTKAADRIAAGQERGLDKRKNPSIWGVTGPTGGFGRKIGLMMPATGRYSGTGRRAHEFTVVVGAGRTPPVTLLKVI